MAKGGRITKSDLVARNATTAYTDLRTNAVAALKAITKQLNLLAKAKNRAGISTKAMNSIIAKESVELKKAQIEIKNLTAANKQLTAAKKVGTAATTSQNAATNATVAANNKAALSFNKLAVSIRQALSRFIGFTIISTVLFGLIRALKDTSKRIVEFDKVMINLGAILGKNRKDLAALENEIKKVAGASIKTSNEVAKLAEVLVVLGKTESEIIGLLKPINNLSIGLQATSQETGELLVMTMNAFGASSLEASKYADIIAKMRTSTALDFERIKDSLGFLAPTANAAGLSLEETAGILGVLVDNGVKASRAGRLTSTMFLRLASDGKTLADALDEVNLAQQKNATETELLAVANELFGKRAGALGLILANNRGELSKLTMEFQKSENTLEKLTNEQLKSLSARMDILNASWERWILNIENGDGALAKLAKTILAFPTRFLNQQANVSQIWKSNVHWSKKVLAQMSLMNWRMDGYSQRIVDVLDKEEKKNGLMQLAVGVIRDYNVEVEKYNKISLELGEKTKDPLNLIKITEGLSNLDIEGLTNFIIAMERGMKVNEQVADSRERTVGVIDKEIAVLRGRQIAESSINDDWVHFEEMILKLQKERLAITGKQGDAEIKYLEGSIGFLKNLVKKNQELIIATDDDKYRKRLQRENEYLEKQIKLLEKIPALVTATSIGITTLEDAEKAKAKAKRKGTAQAGGTVAGDTGDFNFDPSTAGDKKPQPDVDIMGDVEVALFDIEQFREKYGEQMDMAIDATNMFFDNRIERLEQDREANKEYFDALIANEQGNAAEQDRLRREKELKDEQLRKKQQKLAKKQAVFNKALAIAEIGINTARAIVAGLAPPPLGLGPVAGVPLAVLTGAIGAAQIAAVIAQPVPKFKDGKDLSNWYEGFAMVNDGRSQEFREDRLGNISAFSGRNVLTHVKKDDIIHKDLSSLISSKGFDSDALNNASIMSSLFNSGKAMSNLEREISFNQNLDKYQGQIKNEIKRGFKYAKNETRVDVNFDHSLYKEDTL